MEHEKLRLNQQIVIIINGKGGSGKDTVCEIVSRFYRTRIISSITPIKEIAKKYGWNGEKDNRARRFLSDLKRAFVSYNDLPNCYLESEYQKFKTTSDADILFIHIREPEQIDDFRRRIQGHCVTLFIRSAKVEKKLFGNDSDDMVENYSYDYYYVNNMPLEQLSTDFMKFFHTLLVAENSLSDN